jgi:hypothetical protein
VYVPAQLKESGVNSQQKKCNTPLDKAANFKNLGTMDTAKVQVPRN